MSDVLDRIYDRLVDALIVYQQRLESPWPSPTETKASLILKYRNDVLFHNKVDSMASGIVRIVADELNKYDIQPPKEQP